MRSASAFWRGWVIIALGLIVFSTALFVVSVVIERGGLVSTPTNVHQGGSSVANSSSDPDGGHDETPVVRTSQGNGNAETVFGVDLESPWVIGAYVVIWLGLALALLRLGRIAWVALLGAALVVGALDVGEVARQLSAAHWVVAVFSGLVVFAHGALVVIAFLVLVQQRGMPWRWLRQSGRDFQSSE